MKKKPSNASNAKSTAMPREVVADKTLVLRTSGNSSTAASSGNSSTAASSGNSSTAASSGNSSKAASSGDSSKAASSGYSGIAAAVGNNGRAKAGPNGLVIVTYWVEAEKRYRACVGNVGEDGIKEDVWYVVRDAKLVETS